MQYANSTLQMLPQARALIRGEMAILVELTLLPGLLNARRENLNVVHECVQEHQEYLPQRVGHIRTFPHH